MNDSVSKLKVDDKEYLQYNEYKQIANNLERIFDKYINILSSLVSEDILKGKLAENIKEFTSKASFCLNNTIASTGESCSCNVNEFLLDIDKADKNLY